MKKVNRLVKNNFLNERLNQFDQLTELISTFMSHPLENRVWPLIRGRRLILMTDDPQLATQARFMEKPLCKHLNQQNSLKLSGVDVKLVNMPLTRKGKRLNRNPISTDTADVISSIAESIDDKELQHALQRLSAQTSTNN
ncbi:MAG: hypothetical protein ACPGVP_03685 [Thiolinea sp.]